MKECKMCTNPTDVETCNKCGYSFSKDEIVEKDRLRGYVKSLNWVEEVKLKKRLNDHYIAKYGHSSTSPESTGWSEKKTAKMLDEANSLTSPDIRLAEALDNYPELLERKRKSHAKSRLDQINKGIPYKEDKPKLELEQDLQKYISSHWDQTPFSEEWELTGSGAFREGKVKTGIVGEMDLLARHRKDKKWLVIELKKGQSSDETVGQVLRYMGWVKEQLAGKDEEVKGVIISATVDERIQYALNCVPDVNLIVYNFDENGKLSFEKVPNAFFHTIMKALKSSNLQLSEINKLIEELQQISNQKATI